MMEGVFGAGDAQSRTSSDLDRLEDAIRRAPPRVVYFEVVAILTRVIDAWRDRFGHRHGRSDRRQHFHRPTSRVAELADSSPYA
jgi:hypothetical protein